MKPPHPITNLYLVGGCSLSLFSPNGRELSKYQTAPVDESSPSLHLAAMVAVGICTFIGDDIIFQPFFSSILPVVGRAVPAASTTLSLSTFTQ